MMTSAPEASVAEVVPDGDVLLLREHRKARAERADSACVAVPVGICGCLKTVPEHTGFTEDSYIIMHVLFPVKFRTYSRFSVAHNDYNEIKAKCSL